MESVDKILEIGIAIAYIKRWKAIMRRINRALRKSNSSILFLASLLGVDEMFMWWMDVCLGLVPISGCKFTIFI